jgi:hypothetical protein
MSTETVAIIVPAFVALAAIWSMAYQHLRGLSHERALVDLGNVRDVLDEAAVALHRAAYVLDEVRSTLIQHDGVRFFKTAEGTQMYKELGGHGQVLDALYERLSVRFGRDCKVAVVFKEADEAVLGVWRAVGSLRHEPESDGTAAVSAEIKSVNRQQKTEIEAERKAFDAAREAFVASAYSAAGARLPPR